MKKIFKGFLLSLLCLPILNVHADYVDINYYLNLAKQNNIDINEVVKRPYLGCSHERIENSTKPYIIVFADFTDFTTAAMYVNDGYYVYNHLNGNYGFSAFNTKNPENAILMKKYKVKRVPYVLVTNPYRKEVVPIKSALYNNPERLVKLLEIYLKRTHD